MYGGIIIKAKMGSKDWLTPEEFFSFFEFLEDLGEKEEEKRKEEGKLEYISEETYKKIQEKRMRKSKKGRK